MYKYILTDGQAAKMNPLQCDPRDKAVLLVLC